MVVSCYDIIHLFNWIKKVFNTKRKKKWHLQIIINCIIVPNNGIILIHLLDKPVCGIIKRFNLNRCIQLHILLKTT